MSKVANMLNMIKILKDEKIHSLQELARELEVSPRMIRQYKIELEQAGIYISSTTGKYGGYRLEEELNSIDIGLTEKEISTLVELASKLKDIEEKNILLKIRESYIKNKEKQDKTKLSNIEQKSQNLTEIYQVVRKAINEKKKMKITFYSVNTGTTKRVIHPTELFEYIDNWYVAAFCELRNEIRLFKLEDMKEFELLEERYNQNFTIKKKL